MARAKKKKLSLEEMLEEALVKEEDKPYEVPSNWVWTRVEIINNYVGKSIDPRKIPNKMFELYSVPSFDNNYPEILLSNDIGSTKKEVSVGDVLLCKINPRINRVWRVSRHTQYNLIASSEWIVIRNNIISSKYLMWCLKSKYFREYLLSNVSGVGGSLMRAKPKFVKEYPLPIAPLAEQQRIIDTIESLFEKLDKAKELVKNALDSFENRKAAILNKAFTGELTTKWREKNGVSLDDWEEKTLGKVCKSIFDGDHMPPPKSEVGVPFLIISNINKGYLNFENTRFVPKDYYDKISDTRKPHLGDILYTTVGSYGIPVLVDDEREFCFQRHMALLKPQQIKSKFLWYLLQNADIYNKVTEIATGTAQLTIPIKGLREVEFLLPQQSEQKEIICILDKLLENEQKAKELCDVIEKIDLMKKAILARAFRGELDTNNPEEESAVELLKEVLTEKNKETKVQDKKTTKKR